MERRIGLLGLTFTDPNKGCEALTYTFLNMLSQFYENDHLEIVCFMRTNEFGKIPESFPMMTFKCHVLNIYSIASWISVYKDIHKCDCVFDASYGDGFTGIYGARRNFVQALRKQLVISANRPLFLLPQTYGLYHKYFKKWSISLIKSASLAYARDEATAKVIGDFVKTTSDMAFGLPFDKSRYSMKDGVNRIGINVSSLLWDEDTCKRFALTVDYKVFYFNLLDYLISKSDFEIHLIPHVVDLKNPNSGENDYRICQYLKSKYGDKVILAPPFETAIDAKSYISNMNIFLGSRMHATIGAISSGVTTIPFSYCHKFEALYSNIGYAYLLSATKISTEQALQTTFEWINNPQVLYENGVAASENAIEKLNVFKAELRNVLFINKLL